MGLQSEMGPGDVGRCFTLNYLTLGIFWRSVKLYFLGGEGHDIQGTKLSVTCAAAEKTLGLFPGKWVMYYPLISALETGFKIASAAEGFFSFV